MRSLLAVIVVMVGFVSFCYPQQPSSRGPTSVKKDPAPTREDDPFDRLPPDLQKVRLWLDVCLWKKWNSSDPGPESLLSWKKEFLTEFATTNPGEKPPLGTLPVVVVSSDPRATESDRRSRDAAAPRLDFLSFNTVHITAAGSGHEIHLYQPDRVIEGVLETVSVARSGLPLSHP